MTEADYLEAVAPLTDRGAPLDVIEETALGFCDLVREYGPAAMAEQVVALQRIADVSESEASRISAAMLVRFCPELV